MRSHQWPNIFHRSTSALISRQSFVHRTAVAHRQWAVYPFIIQQSTNPSIGSRAQLTLWACKFSFFSGLSELFYCPIASADLAWPTSMRVTDGSFRWKNVSNIGVWTPDKLSLVYSLFELTIHERIRWYKFRIFIIQNACDLHIS